MDIFNINTTTNVAFISWIFSAFLIKLISPYFLSVCTCICFLSHCLIQAIQSETRKIQFAQLDEGSQ